MARSLSQEATQVNGKSYKKKMPLLTRCTIRKLWMVNDMPRKNAGTFTKKCNEQWHITMKTSYCPSSDLLPHSLSELINSFHLPFIPYTIPQHRNVPANSTILSLVTSVVMVKNFDMQSKCHFFLKDKIFSKQYKKTN